uniref:Uncharacterized protein n=1 Tax=Arundo donax TaxID=35708 RepID=A0A0A9ERP0_ARUDO
MISKQFTTLQPNSIYNQNSEKYFSLVQSKI